MIIPRLFLLLLPCLLLAVASDVSAQTKRPDAGHTAAAASGARSTAAFAEVVVRRTELEAELESLLVEYTEEFPRVKELRFGIQQIEAERDRLLKMKPEQTVAATSALGKLMVKKVDAEVDLWKLKQAYADGHPDVKRAQRRVEIFERAIRDILG